MTPSSFDGLGLVEPLRLALKTEKHLKPTPIQARTIPLLIQGKDLLGIAETGSGKTAAFALPILQLLSLQRLPRSPGAPHALILAPTRELAIQIHERIGAYGRGLHLRSGLTSIGVRSSHARITSILTCRRAIKSRSTISPSQPMGCLKS